MRLERSDINTLFLNELTKIRETADPGKDTSTAHLYWRISDIEKILERCKELVDFNKVNIKGVEITTEPQPEEVPKSPKVGDIIQGNQTGNRYAISRIYENQSVDCFSHLSDTWICLDREEYTIYRSLGQ